MQCLQVSVSRPPTVVGFSTVQQWEGVHVVYILWCSSGEECPYSRESACDVNPGTTFVRSACGIDPMVQQRGGAHLVLIPGAEEGEEPMWFDSLIQQWRGAYLE